MISTLFDDNNVDDNDSQINNELSDSIVDNTLLSNESVNKSTTEKYTTQTSTTTEGAQRVNEISTNEVIENNIVQEDNARKFAPKTVVSAKPADFPKSTMSAAYNNLVTVTSKPFTDPLTLRIPPVTATNTLLATIATSTPPVNTFLLVTRSGYCFPDIPDPLGIIETMISAE